MLNGAQLGRRYSLPFCRVSQRFTGAQSLCVKLATFLDSPFVGFRDLAASGAGHARNHSLSVITVILAGIDEREDLLLPFAIWAPDVLRAHFHSCG
jgi:hypothetical protein